jgi:hypothetical protein
LRLITDHRLLITVGVLAVALSATAEPAAILPADQADFLDTYCMDCHDAETEKGKLNLEDLPFKIETLQQAELWQKVLNTMNAGEMPPEDKKQPKGPEKADFLDDLALTMVVARKALSDSGGTITMRRLNRREYQNTIKHLLGVEPDVGNLPSDEGSGSFDTVGASQFISSDQFEQYLTIGRKAIDEAFERQQPRKTRTYRVETEETVNKAIVKQMKRMEEDYERYQAWTAGVDKAAKAPENANVKAKLNDNDFKFYRSANQIKGAPAAKDFGFRDHNAAVQFYQGAYNRHYAHMKHSMSLPGSKTGAYLKRGWGTNRFDLKPKPKSVPPGRYVLRVRAGIVDDAPAFRHFIEIGHPQTVNNVTRGFDGFPFASMHITGTLKQPSIVETTIEVSAHTPRAFGIQERQPTSRGPDLDWYNAQRRENGYGVPSAIWVDWIELEGPLPDKEPFSVFKDILAKHPHSKKIPGTDRARSILSEFTDAALRGTKPDPAFVDKLTALFVGRREAGEAFDVAIRTPLSVILASPGFLYLNEPGTDASPRALNDRELAVRLAYFLWSAPPDEKLLKLGEKEKLSRPGTLREQVDRMIADPRSDAFVSGFVHQWLDMERLDFFQFDGRLHRDFDENMRTASRQEVYQSFTHLMRDPENGRLGKLLKSDYVMINGILGTYYGIDVTGDAFRKVKLPADSPRGGLLGMAAIHAMGSDGIESSPVERGAWVLRHLLHDPPPPAPPNVPQLSRLADKPLSTRERLNAHQEQPQCASCHRKIDPIGFGMENFDAAGKWRDIERIVTVSRKGQRSYDKRRSHKIDASGQIHGGREFTDYNSLRDVVTDREDDFARGFTEHLIAYGLGRNFAFTDQDLADSIMKTAKKDSYAVSAFIAALVQSEEFRRK